MNREAAHAGVLDEALVEDGSATDPSDHHRLHVVEDLDFGAAAEEGQRAVEAPEKTEKPKAPKYSCGCTEFRSKAEVVATCNKEDCGNRFAVVE